MGIPPDRRDLLKILPPDLMEALRQPMTSEARRELIRAFISDELARIQALRYVEELRRGGVGDDRPATPEDE